MPQDTARFTVHEPFMGVMVVQMNTTFCKMLQQFLEDAHGKGAIEPELWALRRALSNPHASRRRFEEKKRIEEAH